ncbi:MAG: hypothetical protein AB7S39_05935 [Gemmatimonadales bacterium]
MADTVAAGPATLTFLTFGSSTCTRPGGEGVESGPGYLTIVSYDVAVAGAAICTDDLRLFRRYSAVVLRPGPVTLRLRGRGQTGPVVIERTIWVQP